MHHLTSAARLSWLDLNSWTCFEVCLRTLAPTALAFAGQHGVIRHGRTKKKDTVGNPRMMNPSLYMLKAMWWEAAKRPSGRAAGSWYRNAAQVYGVFRNNNSTEARRHREHGVQIHTCLARLQRTAVSPTCYCGFPALVFLALLQLLHLLQQLHQLCNMKRSKREGRGVASFRSARSQAI